MARVDAPGSQTEKIVEPKAGVEGDHALLERVLRLERLIRAIEEELADEELGDEQKLQNIGERVALLLDGR